MKIKKINMETQIVNIDPVVLIGKGYKPFKLGARVQSPSGSP